MKSYIFGVVAVLVSAGLMYIAWSYYEDFLHQGRRPPDTVQKLISIEKEGIPKVEITDLEGQKIQLGDFVGKVVIVNFWASWCEPCVKEFPSLMKLLERFKGDVKLVAVSGDFERNDIDVFLKAFDVKSPHIIVSWDKDQATAKLFGTYKLPESYIFGTDGQFVRKIVGVDDWATPDAFMYFDRLINERKSE